MTWCFISHRWVCRDRCGTIGACSALPPPTTAPDAGLHSPHGCQLRRPSPPRFRPPPPRHSGSAAGGEAVRRREARAEAGQAARPVAGHPGQAARGARHRWVLGAARGRSDHGRADLRSGAAAAVCHRGARGTAALCVRRHHGSPPAELQDRGGGGCDLCRCRQLRGQRARDRHPPAARPYRGGRFGPRDARPAGDQAGPDAAHRVVSAPRS